MEFVVHSLLFFRSTGQKLALKFLYITIVLKLWVDSLWRLTVVMKEC